MSADDVRHRARATADLGPTGRARPAPSGARPCGPTAVPHAVASRVPAEYRDAYLDGFARACARRGLD